MANPNLLNITSVVGDTIAGAQMASGDNTLYTVPANKVAKLNNLVLCNTSTSAVTVSVSKVPTGGTLDGTHKVVSGYSLAAGDSTVVSEVAGWLGPGGFISINASAASAVDATLDGLVLS